MFNTLLGLMKQRKITQKRIAQALGCSEVSVSLKMQGKREWTLYEMCIIKRDLFPDKTLDEIFDTNTTK